MTKDDVNMTETIRLLRWNYGWKKKTIPRYFETSDGIIDREKVWVDFENNRPILSGIQIEGIRRLNEVRKTDKKISPLIKDGLKKLVGNKDE